MNDHQKTTLRFWLWTALVAILCLIGIVQQPSAQTLNGVYIGQSATVNSTTVPVQVLAPGTWAGWIVTTKSTASVPIDCFLYTGSLPGSVPSNFNFIVSPGGNVNDNQVSTSKPLPNYGIGCVRDAAGADVVTAATGRTP